MGALGQALQGERVYLDANVFIYALEGVEPWASPLRDGRIQRARIWRFNGGHQ